VRKAAHPAIAAEWTDNSEFRGKPGGPGRPKFIYTTLLKQSRLRSV
jgi:hypothetical protein